MHDCLVGIGRPVGWRTWLRTVDLGCMRMSEASTQSLMRDSEFLYRTRYLLNAYPSFRSCADWNARPHVQRWSHGCMARSSFRIQPDRVTGLLVEIFLGSPASTRH